MLAITAFMQQVVESCCKFHHHMISKCHAVEMQAALQELQDENVRHRLKHYVASTARDHHPT